MILCWWDFHEFCINEEELKTLKKIWNWFHAWWIRKQIQDLKKCPHQIKGIPLSQGKTTHEQLVYIIHYSYWHGKYFSIWFENSCLHYKLRKIETNCFLSKKMPMHLQDFCDLDLFPQENYMSHESLRENWNFLKYLMHWLSLIFRNCSWNFCKQEQHWMPIGFDHLNVSIGCWYQSRYWMPIPLSRWWILGDFEYLISEIWYLICQVDIE